MAHQYEDKCGSTPHGRPWCRSQFPTHTVSGAEKAALETGQGAAEHVLRVQKTWRAEPWWQLMARRGRVSGREGSPICWHARRHQVRGQHILLLVVRCRWVRHMLCLLLTPGIERAGSMSQKNSSSICICKYSAFFVAMVSWCGTKEILIDYTEIEWEEAVHMVLLGYKNCN
jgi:hypothetical protein